MAIKINDFSIIENGTKLSIKLETDLTYNITSILLWDINNYSTSLNYKIIGDTNIEEFILLASELEIEKFEDIYFIKIESNAPVEECPTCINPAIGATYNLYSYYKCMLEYLYNISLDECVNCNNLQNKNITITISLLIESVIKCLEIGLFTQAVESINKLKKLCELKQCNSCKNIECKSCGKFNQIQ